MVHKIAFIILLVFAALILFRYQLDIAALKNFSDVYQQYQQGLVPLNRLKTAASIKISSLIKNDAQLMESEQQVVRAAAASDSAAVSSAFDRFLELSGQN